MGSSYHVQVFGKLEGALLRGCAYFFLMGLSDCAQQKRFLFQRTASAHEIKIKSLKNTVLLKGGIKGAVIFPPLSRVRSTLPEKRVRGEERGLISRTAAGNRAYSNINDRLS